ncbi:MAG: hypothetical protein IJZ81_01200, partial [Clostridia bacterium]|nr:hypothetical protein [Clostridia bacterium]
TNKGATKEEKRYYQILNSVVDRNIRFVTINQLTNGTDTFGEKSEKTNLATKRVMDKLESIGFNVKDYDTVYDYSVNTTQASAIAMVIMIIMGLTIIEWLFGKRLGKLEIIAAIGAVLSIGFTYKAPIAIVSLYPTLFAAIAPCFAITAAMVYVRDMRNKLTASWLTLSTVLLTVAVLGICAMIQSSLLAGLDYYINSVIFRGIKISLLLPIAYTILVYGIIFVDKSDNYFAKIVKILNARIKVYWMVIGALIGVVGAIYLIRSGNVSEISPMENFMRNTITEIMYARPRTKEFLIGWPCLILFVYYIKNTNCKIMQWCTAIGSSILFASIMNTFCHVFTAVQVMYTRSLNGFIVGAIVSAFAFVLNIVIIRAVKYFIKKGNQNG